MKLEIRSTSDTVLSTQTKPWKLGSFLYISKQIIQIETDLLLSLGPFEIPFFGRVPYMRPEDYCELQRKYGDVFV